MLRRASNIFEGTKNSSGILPINLFGLANVLITQVDIS
jgi:hypothetical protein